MTYDCSMLRAILVAARDTVQTAYVQPPEPDSHWAQDTAQDANRQCVEWWSAEAVRWDGRYALRRQFGADDDGNSVYLRLHNVLYRASMVLYGEPRSDGTQGEALAIYDYALDHLENLLAEQEAEGWQPPNELERDYRHIRECLRVLFGEPTLGVVRVVLRESTCSLIEQQVGAMPLTLPLRRVLSQLHAQTLAVIISDLEDAPNTGEEALPERVLLDMLRACRAEGERRFGQRLFDAMVAEYE